MMKFTPEEGRDKLRIDSFSVFKVDSTSGVVARVLETNLHSKLANVERGFRMFENIGFVL